MANRVNLFIDQGATFSYPIELTDGSGADIITTNLTANSMMRKAYTSTNSISFTANVANGVLTLSLTALQTSNITPGRYVYDAYLYDSVANTSTRTVEGFVTVKASATH